MDEYIKREDALKAVTYNGLTDPTLIVSLTLLVAQKNIRKIPAADVVPRRILFDLERKLHSMLPFKAHSILTDDKYMANSYEMGQERVIYDILNFLAELEKNTRKENGDGTIYRHTQGNSTKGIL